MKILFCICLPALVLASYIAWTLKPSELEKGRTRLVWVSDSSPVRQEQIDLFNQLHPDIFLTLDPGNLAMEKIIVQSLAGIGPDVFDVAGLYPLDGFVRAGIAMDLTDIAADYGIEPEKTWSSLSDCVRIDSRQYAFPAGVYANVLFYNKDLFDRYGVEYPPYEMNWEQFVEVSRQMTRQSPDGRGVESFGVMDIHWYDLVLQAGGRIYSSDGLRCVLDSPEAIEAIEFYHDLMKKYRVMPTQQEESLFSGEGGWGIGSLRWFASGRLGMVQSSRWGLVYLRQYEHLKGRIGVSHLPSHRRKVGLVSAKMIAVNRNTPHLDEAMRFMKFLTGEEFNRQVVRSADFLPPIPEYARTEEFLNDPHFPDEDFNTVFVEAMERGTASEVSTFIDPLTALRIIGDHLDLAINGVKTPAQACRDMTFAINRRIVQNLRRYEKYRERYHAVTGRVFQADDPEWQAFH